MRLTSVLPLVVTILVLQSGCTRLEAFPAVVQVPQSAGTMTFDLYARLRKDAGSILNDGIQWTAPPGITLTPDHGRNVQATVNAASPGDYVIRVEGKGKKDQVLVRVIALAGDIAKGPAGEVPSVVGIFGNPATCPPDTTFAFVTMAQLGDRTNACRMDQQQVVAMTATRAQLLWNGPWTDAAGDVVDAASAPPPTTLTIRAWRLTTAPASDVNCSFGADPDCGLLSDLVTEANGIFMANRVGIEVSWDKVITPRVSSDVTCAEIQSFIDPDGDGTPAGDRWKAGVVNLYLLAAGGSTSSRGTWCWGPGLGWQSNVIKYQRDAVVSTLTHELGHLLGLHTPWGTVPVHMGHVDRVKGFAHDNVMFAMADLSSSASRTRFSLGQVYRMNFDRRSFLVDNAAGVDCGCDPYASPCGRLSRDTRAIIRSSGHLGANSAFCPTPPEP